MKIPKKKKFKTVLVNLSTLTNDNLELLFESSSFLHDMQNIAYESIKFNFDKATAPMFTIKNTNYSYSIEKSSYKNLLQKCLTQFEKDEDYIKCVECRNLMTTI